MNIHNKKILPLALLTILVSMSSHAIAANCQKAMGGNIDRSRYSIEQIQSGLKRSFFIDLNESETFKKIFNSICLEELVEVLKFKRNPNPSDAYIDNLLAGNKLNPQVPSTLAQFINNAQEPVTNPIFGQMISLIFERGAGIQAGECFTFNVQVTSSGSKVLLYTLTIEKRSQLDFKVIGVTRETLDQAREILNQEIEL